MNTTPIPWKIKPDDKYSVALARLVDANGKRIFTNQYNDNTAALIVRAVNNHQKLIDVLEALVHDEEATYKVSGHQLTLVENGRAALKSAKEEV